MASTAHFECSIIPYCSIIHSSTLLPFLNVIITLMRRDFRTVFSRIGEVRSLLSSGVKLMALTATATKQLWTKVEQTIGMKNKLVVSISPCKANIMYSVGCLPQLSDTFHPILDRLCSDRSKLPQTIIYCRRFEDCADLYLFSRNQLGANFTEPPAKIPTNWYVYDLYCSSSKGDH